MIPGALARRYARALLGLAQSPMQRDQFAKDLTAVATVAEQRDEAGTQVIGVLASERFTQSDRRNLLATLGRKVGVDPMVLKFLEHVLKKDRIDGLADIARAYERMADEAAGRVRAEVTSAAQLAPDAVSRIQHALQKATGKTVVLTTHVDPDLIGGVVAKVGSYVIDGSVRSTLAQLRTELRS